jgi:hypothetical protein
MGEALKLTLVRIVFLRNFLCSSFTVSVEDASNCKRSISVPGVLVNVRRVVVSDTLIFIIIDLITVQ